MSEYVCARMHVKEDDAISTLNDNSLILIDHFTYFKRNISFTESDVNVRIEAAGTTINSFLAISKSNLSDILKRKFS